MRVSKKGYRIIDIATADMAFEAFGKNLSELFENCAFAFNAIMLEIKGIKPAAKKKIRIESEDLKALLFDFLSELIFLKDTNGLIFSKYKIAVSEKNGRYILQGEIFGEKWDRKKHDIWMDIKAMTYSEMEIDKLKKGKSEYWRAQGVVDT